MRSGTRNILAAIVGGALLASSQGCSRPTKHESVYRINLENEYSWKGTGPGIFFFAPWYETEKTSHKRQVMNFPYGSRDDVGKESSEQALIRETDQSIVTARGDSGIKEIMIQEMIIAYNVKPNVESVKKYAIEHRREDQEYLVKNLDGIVRTFLQTKRRDYVEGKQPDLGRECLEYIKNFRTGGKPVFDNDDNFVKFDGSYTIEEEWGIELTEVTPKRVRAPSYVLSAHPEAEAIKKKGQAELESAEADASRRRSKLNSIQNIIEEIGDNDAAAKYLSSQIVAEMLEQLGSENIGRLRITQGLRSPEARSKMAVDSAVRSQP